MVQRATFSLQTPIRILRGRWKLFGCCAVGLIVPLVFLWLRYFGPPTSLIVSAETSVLTGPLTADGAYVDYAAAHFQQFTKSSPETDPLLNLWLERPQTVDDLISEPFENGTTDVNAFMTSRSHLAVDGRSVPTIQFPTSYLTAQASPWTTDDNRLKAAKIESWDGWLTEIFHADNPPVAVSLRKFAGQTTFRAVEIRLSFAHLKIADVLSWRASLAIGEGDLPMVLKCLTMLRRLVDRERTLPIFFCQRDAHIIRHRQAMLSLHTLTYFRELSEEQIYQIVALMDTAYQKHSQRVNNIRRSEFLDILQHCHHSGFQRGPCGIQPGTPFASSLWRDGWIKTYRTHGIQGLQLLCEDGRLRRNSNFNAMMRALNKEWDRFLATTKLSSFVDQEREQDKIRDEHSMTVSFDIDEQQITSSTATENEITTWAVSRIMSHATTYPLMTAAEESLNRAVRIGGALACYRKRNGKYPSRLSDLGHSAECTATFDDAMSDRPISYHPGPNGYRLNANRPDNRRPQFKDTCIPIDFTSFK